MLENNKENSIILYEENTERLEQSLEIENLNNSIILTKEKIIEDDDESNKFAFQVTLLNETTIYWLEHKWINTIAKSTITLYIQKILEISSFTDYGTKQLITDISKYSILFFKIFY